MNSTCVGASNEEKQSIGVKKERKAKIKYGDDKC